MSLPWTRIGAKEGMAAGEVAEWFNAHAWKMEKHLLSYFGLIENSVELRGFRACLKSCLLGLV
jgi:hypothetical protein